MSEAAFAELFTVIRAFLVGGILLAIPLVARKGLLFGTYVGEEFADSDAARRLRRRWYIGCIAIPLLALGGGLAVSLMGWPVAGNLAGLALLLLGGPLLYITLHREALKLVPLEAALQAETAAAPLDYGEPKSAALAELALSVCICAGLVKVLYAARSYDALPSRVPSPFGWSGAGDGWSEKSVATVMMLSVANLVICPIMALFALLTAQAKRSVRGGSGGRSIEAQNAFRSSMANVLSGTALFSSALLTFKSVETIRIGLSKSHFMSGGSTLIAVAMHLFMIGSLVWIAVKFGQGGARMEDGSAAAPLTNGLADNTRWIWGVFYVNKVDPSILVENRFGLGYTLNFGNPRAVLILLPLVLFLGLAALALIYVGWELTRT